MCIHYCTDPANYILIECVQRRKIKVSSNALTRRYRICFLIRPTSFQTSRTNFGSASDIRNRFIIFFLLFFFAGSILLLMNSKMVEIVHPFRKKRETTN